MKQHFFGITLLLGWPLMLLAGNAQMNATLVQVINTLHAVVPQLQQAAREQAKNPRIKVHYTQWVDGQGHRHNGVIDDVKAIEASLIKTVNRQSVEPRVVKPLPTDFTR